MLSKILIATALVATTFVGTASAVSVCDNTTGTWVCVDTGSYQYGTCSDGYAGNYASVSSWGGSGFNAVYAGTYCYGDSTYPYDAHGLYAGAYSWDGATWHQAYASWDEYNFGSFSGCQILVYLDGMWQSQDCSAVGAPGPYEGVLP